MTDHGENDQIQGNFKPIPPKEKAVAVAIKDSRIGGGNPNITAAARGALAEKILEIAYENDIKVRSDGDLAEMLAEMELDSPIPTEALMAVAEILSYVYRANGEPDPFNAILNDLDSEES